MLKRNRSRKETAFTISHLDLLTIQRSLTRAEEALAEARKWAEASSDPISSQPTALHTRFATEEIAEAKQILTIQQPITTTGRATRS